MKESNRIRTGKTEFFNVKFTNICKLPSELKLSSLACISDKNQRGLRNPTVMFLFIHQKNALDFN